MNANTIDPARIEAAREFLQSNGDQTLPWNRVLLAAEALDRGLDLEYRHRGRQLTISRGGRRYHLRGLSTNYNSALATRLCRLRDATSKYLMAMEVPTVENCVFAAGEEGTAWAWSQKILPVSVQPNSRMRNVPPLGGLSSEAEFREAFGVIAQDQPDGVLVQQDPPGEDYRGLVVDGRLVAALRLAPAHVIGDGQRTVAELIAGQNAESLPYPRRLEVGEAETELLAGAGLTPASVPAAGERAFLAAHARVDATVYATDVTETLGRDHRTEIEYAVERIPGLRLAGVDARITDAGGLLIMGITARPTIAPHHFPQEGEPRNAAGEILAAMFPTG